MRGIERINKRRIGISIQRYDQVALRKQIPIEESRQKIQGLKKIERGLGRQDHKYSDLTVNKVFIFGETKWS